MTPIVGGGTHTSRDTHVEEVRRPLEEVCPSTMWDPGIKLWSYGFFNSTG